ncbi:hypothetical protein COLO4_26156 [Corchorus olitorius]|uniref:Uncharacterized protein n=1 Tax=Corchorus olitorius TaxID=93759 RepID=A0A1R3HYQ3_9ROSI|nr:hypothetical protein COLO4_26156 [Corchorus olitorius]
MHYMHRPQRESFVIQISETLEAGQAANTVSPKFTNLSSMKLFNRFRKILMRFIFSIPSPRRSSGSSSSSMAAGSKQKNYCDKFDPPKTSCSSYYSSQSHYSEAIADCIEFFNKSSQEGILDGRKSDVFV